MPSFFKIIRFPLFYIIFATIIVQFSLFAQVKWGKIDTIVVDIVERRIGKQEISILLRDKIVYLPFNDIFDWLRLKYEFDLENKTLEGFIIAQDSSFKIEFLDRKGSYKDNIIDIQDEDFIFIKDKIYLNEKIFRNLFNWNIKYDEKKLEVVLKSKIPFPQIQQKQRQRRLQIQIERELIESDIYIKRQPLIFNLGKLNYNINVYNFRSQEIQTRYNFILGGQLLYGDFETSIRGNIKERIKERDLRGFIKYPFFQNRILQQITIGDISKLSFVGGSLFGVDITNIPAERRFEFSKYTITSKISPSSEYYLTGRIVSPKYITTKNDTVVSIPTKLYYGFSQYTERIYDWYGQEKVKETYLIIPQSMIPPGYIDYRISAGILRQKNYPEYSSIDLGYGATEYITLGTGIEYLNKKDLKGKFFPYTYTTVRFYNNIYGTAEFSPFVIGRGSLNYQTFDGKIFNLNFSVYNKNKILNPRDIKSSYGSGLFLPFNVRRLNALFIDIENLNVLLNMNFNQNFLTNGKEQFLRGGIGSYFKNINLTYNIFRSSLWYKYFVKKIIEDEDTGENILVDIEYKTYIRTMQSDFSVSLAPTRFSNLNTGLRFDHIVGRIKSVNLGINIYLFSNISVSLLAERDFLNKQIFSILNVSFNPQYVSTSAGAILGSFGNSYSASIRGELIGSTQTFDLLFNRITQRNRGYFLSSAFLDLNNNGRKDKGEQYLENVRITTQRRVGLGIPFSRRYDRYNYLLAGEHYRDYILSVRTYDLEDPLWVPKYSGIELKSEPNKLKRIEIPVVTGGIISGIVINEEGNPIGGLAIKLSKDDKIKKMVLTNSRGEFEFPTVPPGDYNVYIDEDVLKTSNAISEPAVQKIQITGDPEKGFVSLSFVVKFK